MYFFMQSLHLLSKELHFLFEAQLSSIWWTLCKGERDISKELIKIQIRVGQQIQSIGKDLWKASSPVFHGAFSVGDPCNGV